MTFDLTETGAGRPVLLLHGGGGTPTVAPIAAHLAPTTHVITPTHPGWNGTERNLDTVAEIAAAYLAVLAERGLSDVLVIGSSLGGWIASEMALQDAAGLVTGVILINAVGILVAEQPIRDFFALDARGVAEYSFHDSEKFYRDPATVPDAQKAIQASNMAAMRAYVGEPYMHDPTLRSRLAAVAVPTLVIWGESDRIVTPAYGRAFAEAFGNAEFALVHEAGHLPQLEKPAETFALIDAFAATR